MLRCIFNGLLLLSFASVFANDSTATNMRPKDSANKITVTKDQRIDQLNKRQAIQNRYGSFSPHLVKEKGYRVQVMNTQNRVEALHIKAKLMSRFPALGVYLFFREPFFTVRIGNFKTREEASRFVETHLDRDLVYIVPDMIEYMWHPPPVIE